MFVELPHVCCWIATHLFVELRHIFVDLRYTFCRIATYCLPNCHTLFVELPHTVTVLTELLHVCCRIVKYVCPEIPASIEILLKSRTERFHRFRPSQVKNHRKTIGTQPLTHANHSWRTILDLKEIPAPCFHRNLPKIKKSTISVISAFTCEKP